MAGDIKSAIRTLQLFEYFGHVQRPARVSEIHLALGTPQSSTSKLLHTLGRRGYLEYDQADRTYFPTIRLAMLGNWLSNDAFENKLLMEITEDLYVRFGATTGIGTSVIVGVQNDIYVMYILERPAVTKQRPPLVRGMLRPLLSAGVGKALMMLKPEDEADLIVRRINSEVGDPTRRINAPAFREEMTLSRERGYALSRGSVFPDAGAVAVPLPPIVHQPRMSLGIGTSVACIDRRLDEMVAALVEKQTLLAEAAARLVARSNVAG